jgi:glutamate-1-semialdehyde 2,1-aminomutase/spore coat polysaccharide biosynthesis protein SpsF
MTVNWEYHRRAQDAIAHGYLTNSKNPLCLGFGAYPTHVKKWSACYVWDSSNKRYTDYICGLGTNLLGYRHVKVVEEANKGGACPSLATELEVEVAEEIKSVFPFIDTLRFLKTGSEACNAAVRIARSFTQKKRVLSEGYHGWGDEFTSLTPPADGVPDLFEDSIEFLGQRPIPEDTAGVMIEPVMLDESRDRVEFLKFLRTATRAKRALLIHDEIITGFRWPQWSASRNKDVKPDLICLGKAMANGYPLAVVGGRKDVMASDYFVSSTYAGDTSALYACKATIKLLKTSYDLKLLWREGQYFLDQFNGIWDEIQIKGYPTRGVFSGQKEYLDLFHQECAAAGVLFGPSWFFNFPLIGETQRTMEVCNDVIRRIKQGSVKLRGEPRQSPFSNRARNIKS